MNKRYLILSGLGIVIIFALWWLWGYINTGTLNIVATGEVDLIINNTSGETVYEGSKKTLRLRRGTYHLIATQNTASTQATTQIKGRSTTERRLDFKAPRPSGVYHSNLPAGSTRVYSIKNSTFVIANSALYRFEAGSYDPIKIAGSEGTYDALPYNQGLLLRKTLGDMVFFDGSTVQSINLNAAAYRMQLYAHPDYTTLVGVQDSQVFWFKNTAASPELLYTATKDGVEVAVGDGVLLAYYPSDPLASEEGKNTYSRNTEEKSVIIRPDKTTLEFKEGIESATWISPSRIAFTTKDGTEIYNLTEQTPAGRTSGSGRLLTVDGQLYIIGADAIWEYSLERNLAFKMAANNGALPINQVAFTENGVFYVGGDSTRKILYKITFDGLNLLEGSALAHTDQYRIDIIPGNDGQEIVISTFAILNRPEQYDEFLATTETYRKAALSYLAGQRINTAGITIKYLPEL